MMKGLQRSGVRGEIRLMFASDSLPLGNIAGEQDDDRMKLADLPVPPIH